MSYSRFYNSNWYLWYDCASDGLEKDFQLLAIAHVKMESWPIYFTYKQLTNDLESCLLTLSLLIPKTKSGKCVSFKRVKCCIRKFIEDVDKEGD